MAVRGMSQGVRCGSVVVFCVLVLGLGICFAEEPDDLRTAIECCRERPRDTGFRLGDSRLWMYFQLRGSETGQGDENLGLHRSKLIFEPRLGKRTTGFVQVLFKSGNESGTDDRIYLLDAWVRFDLGRGKLQLGQFKPPMGLERFTWDGALDLVDRSLATDRLIPNGKLGESFTRDYGVQWTSAWPRARLTSALAVFGGRGANESLEDPAPLWAHRTVWKPKLAATKMGLRRSLRLGLSLATRKGGRRDFSRALPGSAVIGYESFSGRDSRAHVEFLAEHGQWKMVAELFRARFVSDRSEVPSLSADGGYVLIAFQPLVKWSFAARHETFDPNTAMRNPHDVERLIFGASYYLHENRHKIQLNRVFRKSPTGEGKSDTWLLQYQLVI